MALGHVERRLAAILAADVAGYARLMGADEDGNARTAQEGSPRGGRSEAKEYSGRIVENSSDDLLAEFVSVVDALLCATGIRGSAWLGQRRDADGQ